VLSRRLGHRVALIDRSRRAALCSAGRDTFEPDPISFFKLRTDDFTHYFRLIVALRIPTLFVLEGGYAVSEIASRRERSAGIRGRP